MILESTRAKKPILIEMPRGDIHPVRFALYQHNHDEMDEEPFDSIYFTVKKDHTYHQYKFQKSLKDGTIVAIGDGSYQFLIMPEDTNGLDFGTYVFDIQVTRGYVLKQTFTGKLMLTREVTHHCNEETQISGPLEIIVSDTEILELELQPPIVIVQRPDGGGSGATSYDDLPNKPKINGVELSGELTLEDLGIHRMTAEEINDIIDQYSADDPVSVE